MSESGFSYSQKNRTILLSLTGAALVLLAVTSDLFMGNPDGFGLKQTGLMLLGSSILVLLSWSQPDASQPKIVRRFAAVCWPIVGLLGFYFYPEQWSLAYLVIFVPIGAIIWYPDIVPAKWRNFILAALQRGLSSLDPRNWRGPIFLKSTRAIEPNVWDTHRGSKLKVLGVPMLIFSLVTLTLFLQYPIKESLPGNFDTWLAIGLSNTYLAKAQAFLTGIDAGQAMFPVDNVLAYGESSPGGASIFVLFRLFGLNDIWAYYGFISVIFTLNALGVYLLSSLFVRHWMAALFAGFAFAYSNLMFAHIDDSVVFFYFIPALSMFYLIRYFRGNRPLFLYLAAIIGGFQPYFSVYVFIFQTIAIFIMFFFHLHFSTKDKPRDYLLYFKCVLLYILVASPIILFYYSTLKRLNLNPTLDIWAVVTRLSLYPIDPLKVLPNNLIYEGTIPPPVGDYWSYLRHHVFVGFLVPVLALLSLREWNWKKASLLAVGLAGLVLAFGPVLQLGKLEIPSLLYYPYKLSSLVSFLRVPLRAYFLVSLAMVILAAMTVDRVLMNYPSFRGKAAYYMVVILVIIHFFENTPMPLEAFEAGEFIEPSAEYLSYINDNDVGLIVDLPTSFTKTYINWDRSVFDKPADFIYRGDDDQPNLEVTTAESDFYYSDKPLFEYNREVMYLNWQTKHKQDIVGGVNGYLPIPRLIFQRQIMDLPNKGSLDWLEKQGVTHFVFHKNLVLPGEERIHANLEGSIWLSKIFDGNDIVVFTYRELSDDELDSSIANAVHRAKSYLAKNQQLDGSWLSYSYSSEQAGDLQTKHTVFPSIFILTALKDTQDTNPEMINKGLAFVKNKMHEDFLWSVTGPVDGSIETLDGIPCIIPPDSDSTALAWLLIGESFDNRALQTVHSTFLDYRDESGYFYTYFVPEDPTVEDCPVSYGPDLSTGVNISIMAFFDRFGLDKDELEQALYFQLDAANFWERDPFYQELPYLAFLASNAIEEGAMAEDLLDSILTETESVDEFNQPYQFDSVQLAAYVKAKCHQDVLSGENCSMLRPYVEELISRQELDGSFPIAPLYVADVFYGSPAEATAIAINALEMYASHSD